MKYTLLLSSIRVYTLFLIIGLLTLCAALYFYQIQRSAHNMTRGIYHDCQRELETIKADLAFLRRYQNQLGFLTKKGWFQSQNRLIGGTHIKQLSTSLQTIHFRVEPEIIKEMDGGYVFNVSKIIIEIDALLDSTIYDSLESILTNYPGILILRKFSVSRRKNARDVQGDKSAHFVTGEIILEWFSMRVQH